MENKPVKQVIVMRKDLNMRKGKLVAQGSHASLGAILQLMHINGGKISQERTLYLSEGTALYEWLNNSFTKICVSVDSEEELIDIYNKAKEAKLNTIMIEDNGLTEFHGVKTKTCIAIGPNWSEDIDEITKNLKLL